MPVIVTISIETEALGPVVAYLGSSAHPNHRFHEIGEMQIEGAPNAVAFRGRVVSALEFLNLLAHPSHQFTTSARWWVCAFPSGSCLSPQEEDAYAQHMCRVLGCEGFHLLVWHRGLNGSADLNILDPGVDLGVVPVVRRTSWINVLARARHRSDEWTARTNWARAEAKLPEISIVKRWSECSSSIEPSIEKLLTDAAIKIGAKKITPTGMNQVMAAAGFNRADWEIDLSLRLCITQIPRRKKRKKGSVRQCVRIDLQTLIMQLNVELLQREVVGTFTAAESRSPVPTRQTRSASAVRQELRTTVDVLHDNYSEKDMYFN